MTARERLKAWAARFPTMDRAALAACVSRATLFNVISGKFEPSMDIARKLDTAGAVPLEAWSEKAS